MVELAYYDFGYHFFIFRTKKLIRNILNNVKIKRNICKKRKDRNATLIDTKSICIKKFRSTLSRTTKYFYKGKFVQKDRDI